MITTRLALSNRAWPKGTVTARASGKVIATRSVPTSGVVAVRLPANLAVRKHSVTVTYTPTAGTGPKAQTRTVTVTVRQDRAWLKASRSAASYQRGRTGVLIKATASLTSKARPKGTITIKVAGKKIAKRSVPASGKVSVRLPKNLKHGTHRVTISFAPKGATGLRTQTKSLSVKVVKKAAKANSNKKAKKANSIKKAKKVTKANSIKKPKKVTKANSNKKVTRVAKPTSIRTVNGIGARYARGANVTSLAAQYLKAMGAKNVTLQWSLTCPSSRGLIYTSGRVSSGSTSVIRLCASGNFSSGYARNALKFLVAHEYSHILFVRAVGTSRAASYQSVAETEKQADCSAANLSGLSVRSYGTYTTSCSGKLKSTAALLAKGKRPPSLGR